MFRSLAVVALVSGVWPARGVAAGSPKLLVMLVIDQMRADYLTRFDAHWQAGFRLLLDEGAVFERAAYPYLSTVTCPGHATIATGTFPHTHGMVGNGWWRRDEQRTRECVDDDRAGDVSYGRPSKTGHSPRQLAAPTLADELRTQKPGARVVTVAIKDRSAIALAGHGGDAVTWFDEVAGSFVTSRAYAAAPVKIVQDVLRREPLTRDLGRVWDLHLPRERYVQADAGIGERPPTPWSGLFPHPLGGGKGVDERFIALWEGSPFADNYIGRMAAALIDGFALGQRGSTDFLGVSLSALDTVGHAFGPDSREVEDLLIRLDLTLGALIAHLDARVGRDNYVLALSADHGVAPTPLPGSSAGRIAAEDVRERIEDTLRARFGPGEKRPYVTAISGAQLYFAPGVYERVTADPAVWQAVEAAILKVPGVTRVLRTDSLAVSSPDPIVRAAALSHMPGRGGELVIIAAPYWTIAGRNVTSTTTHGAAQPYDQQVPLVLFGGGIRHRRFDDAVTPADIAPTLAKLAGITMTGAEGRVLLRALADAESSGN
jgi:predicted AlkP superfamily pyrophosphatase or phosphodiesterase